MRLTPRQLTASILIGVLLLAGGTSVALAGGQAASDEIHEIGSQEITIQDATITVSDTSLSGPGLPDTTIEDRSYTVAESTTTIEGLTLSVNGETYEICRIEITIEEVGLTLENVELSNGN
ncbi:hypothetical protein [Haladaptatus cibarius]|uniref:hypothetical protein n=1 Tax=Haladaptatus cibarius TaxID=453847 RepID=UPI0006798856|nr:hypothetical protein [Haladaptatus cibarius]